MNKKILFVDDEQSLLNGVERRLGLEFDIVTASSGSAGLEEMEKSGPFAVIISDMQMPMMNGIQFIQNARKISPDSVYLMLTGNQDQATASKAVNEGKVFRFLNKPCESEELKQAVEIALRQYELVTGERELLQKTFVGAVGLLTDVLEMTQPEIFSEVPNIERIFESLRIAVGVEERWEYKLAARLGLVGIALLPEEQRQLLCGSMYSDQEERDLLNQAASVAGRLINKIPRLHAVARIIENQVDVDGDILEGSGNQRLEKLGATFLRVAIRWNILTQKGISSQVALGELQQELPKLSTIIGETLLDLQLPIEEEPVVEVAVCDLQEGMVLADDIITGDGAILLRKRRLLSWTVIEQLRLRKLENKPLCPIHIVESTCCVAEPVLC